MKLSAQYDVPGAHPEHLFNAFFDSALLQRCIPGCEELTPEAGRRYRARVKVGIAAFKGVYTGIAEFRDVEQPDAFTLVVDGKGGGGFVKATARIRMGPIAGGMRLMCDADFQVGGIIAAIGSRLIEAAAKQQMDVFFRKLSDEVVAAGL